MSLTIDLKSFFIKHYSNVENVKHFVKLLVRKIPFSLEYSILTFVSSTFQ